MLASLYLTLDIIDLCQYKLKPQLFMSHLYNAAQSVWQPESSARPVKI